MADITGTWAITGLNTGDGYQELDPALGLELTVDGAQASGFSGVNRFIGPVTIDGSSVSLGPLASTRMAGTEAAMQLETAVLEALGSTASWASDVDEVLLQDAGAGTLLRLTPPSKVPGRFPLLPGTAWTVTDYRSEPNVVNAAVPEARPTLQFSEDGHLSGSLGGNRMMGSYSQDSDRLTLTPVGTTMMMPPPEVYAQEQAVTAALGRVTTVAVDAGSPTGGITFSDDDGTTWLWAEPAPYDPGPTPEGPAE